MTSMFVVIFLEQWLKEKNHISAIIGLIVSTLCLFGFGPNAFMIPTMLVIVFLLAVFRKPIEQVDET